MDQLHILLFGDLKRQPVESVQGMYRFVGVEPSFVPDFDTPHNVGGTPASPILEKMFTTRPSGQPLEPWMPKGAANWIRKLRTRTMRQAPPSRWRSRPSSPAASATTSSARPTYRRDLSHWL